MDKVTEKEFLAAGFIKDGDPLFPFRKELIEWEEVEKLDLQFDEIPCVLYGNSGANKGFCIYTGSQFIFFNAESPREAVKWAEKITNFEDV